MKRYSFFCLFLCCVVWSSSAFAKTLKFSTWHPAVSREVQTVWIPMMEQIESESGKKLRYTIYAGGALGKGQAHYDLIKNGMSDVGYFTLTWTPGRFPLSESLSMAMWIDGKDIAAEIGNELYEKALKDEFKDVKLLELNGCVQSFLWTKNPVENLSDLKGLKLRTPGGMQTRYIQSLGAEPVFMPLGDVYSALNTGAIDGVVTCPPLILAYKLYEVIKNGTVATFGCVTEGLAMNHRTWNSLDEYLQKIVAQATRNPFQQFDALTKKSYQAMLEELKANGVILHHLDDAVQQQWYAAFQQVTRDWVKEQKDPVEAERVVRILAKIVEKHGSEVVAVPAEWQEENKVNIESNVQ